MSIPVLPLTRLCEVNGVSVKFIHLGKGTGLVSRNLRSSFLVLLRSWRQELSANAKCCCKKHPSKTRGRPRRCTRLDLNSLWVLQQMILTARNIDILA
ncbi:hypothetical protein R1flu_015958 [Riccia fluitans]|uniref:Uncharacterized protein n=1 Tax=Riccia fluitans TaxID=41844 RepID=A0ABD1YNJ2_9MARC